ncbi:site-specific integrase [Paraflavisolibacter sp. H34]|uniref:site-specific integrase n=1 Tax=Huijunlia imazamoxiresistens TaxID=3127457 RepID=UPI00301A8A91
MDKQINSLIVNAADHLKSKLFFSIKTVGTYKANWRRIRNFMDSKDIEYYSLEVEGKVLRHFFGNRGIKELTSYEKHLYNAIKMLTEFQQTEQIDLAPRIEKRLRIFNGPIGKAIQHFLDYKRIEERMSAEGIRSYRYNLFHFFRYCNRKGLHAIEEVNLPLILQYLNDLDISKKSNMGILLPALRGLIKYAFNHKLLAVDFSGNLPKYRSVTQPKLPSTYSTEEIEKLISSVNRSSAKGKRDFAIILIAARLGLRASDIARLKFESLHWDTSTLEINQAKTGKELILPLLPDVGNAIIDYLKYGRPQSEEPYVFLTERPPRGPFSSSNVITHVVQRAFKRAGIDTRERRFGPHSLRHSLGARLLEKNTILPVISEVLGHENTESTRFYLRIDLNSMKQCMLDVPPVANGFYEQKGGAFYE